MYDSPLAYCRICNAYVALDQTQLVCALEHRCGHTQVNCPLARVFAGNELSIATDGAGNVSGATASGANEAASVH